MRNYNSKQIFSQGFTIVELIIVVVVIGILTTISTLAYNGAQQRAYEVAILSDAEAMDAAITNEMLQNNGKLVLSDWDNDGKDDGYHYSESAVAAGGQSADIVNQLNEKLKFTPTRGNVIDVRPTNDGKEYCIRVYNQKDLKYNNAFNAYKRESSKKVNNTVSSCEYNEGQSPTVYAGGAVPGAYETVYNSNGTYSWPLSPQPTRIEVVIVGAGGNGGGQCGGGGGGVTVAIIPRSGSDPSIPVTVGQPAALGTTAPGGTSSFGTYTATGGTTPPSDCTTAGAIAGGTGTTIPSGSMSQRYGSGTNGGNGGAINAGLIPVAPGTTGTGGGGGGYGLLAAGQAGGNATYGGGGGGGGGCSLILLCYPGGGGGNPSGQAGGDSSSRTGGNGGGAGGGGGGRGGASGPSVGRGAPGQVRVLTCFENTCNPITTAAP
jgi:prepilin-type N-terminal cleavage/methylation domain-containing protein